MLPNKKPRRLQPQRGAEKKLFSCSETIDLVGGKGQQQPTPTAEETQKRAERGAFLGAFGGSAESDADLRKIVDLVVAAVVEAWPGLTEAQRAEVLRVIKR